MIDRRLGIWTCIHPIAGVEYGGLTESCKSGVHMRDRMEGHTTNVGVEALALKAKSIR